MNWITISWPMAIAACVTLGIIHAQIAVRLRGRTRAAHLCFTVNALSVAITGGFELVLMYTPDLAQYQRLMMWSELPITLMMASTGGFFWFFFGTGRRWMLLTVLVMAATVLVANFLVPPELSIRHAVELRSASLGAGTSFIIARMENGLLTWAEIIVTTLLLAFVWDSSVKLWKKGERRRALIIGGCMVFFLLASRSYAMLVERGIAETPFFFIFPFLGLLVAMGRELSIDVFRAAQLADELRESEHRMELAARAATLGFWVWDLGSDRIWATESARVLFGIPSHEDLDFRRFEETVHPEDRGTVRQAIERTFSRGQDYEVDYRIRGPGGETRWIAARGRIERRGDEQPALFRGVVIDITDRKRAQFDAEQLRREVAHITRVSTMGELSASLAHELNQPLAAILSNAQAARRFLASPNADLDEIRDILDDIVRDDKRAGEVIHRLRAMLQKKEQVEIEAVDMNELVRDAERLMNGELVMRNALLTTRLPPSLPKARAARVEIQQVLLNLMVNALDAMRDRPTDFRNIWIETAESGGRVRTTVRDSGSGIPEQAFPDIFRPFFTTKMNGLGMGLAISRSIVEACGGQLTAQNHPDGGAIFTIELDSSP